jgi:hypothetical protein
MFFYEHGCMILGTSVERIKEISKKKRGLLDWEDMVV